MKLNLFPTFIVFLFASFVYGQSFTLNDKIVQSTRHTSDVFGGCVDISGDYAVVGLAGYDYDANELNYISNAGAVIVFEKINGIWVEKQILTDPEMRASNAAFGFRVSISGDHIVVGSYRDPFDQSGTNSIGNAGSASFFKRDVSGNWNFVNTVVSNNRHIDSYFGRSVAVNGNYAIVGDPFENLPSYPGAGAAYIYKYNGSSWGLLDKITAGDVHADDEFGISVDINGTDAVVGAEANGYSSSGTNFMNASGAAYVFNKVSETNWVQSSKLTASDRASFDNLGFQVSLYDSTVLVSSHYDDQDESGGNTITASGSCYLFKKNISGLWNQSQKIVAPTRYMNDNFGLGLSLYDSIFVVSTRHNSYDENEANYFVQSGSAYVYKLNGTGNWSFDQKIVAPTRYEYDYFGIWTALDGNSIIIGASGQDYDDQEQNLLSSSGAAYIYSMCTPTTSSITVSSCSSYIAPDGQTYNSSGTYTATINNVAGCDSVITIDLTIEDIIAPVADVTTLSNITSECSVTSLTAPTATDNCAGSVTGTHNASLPITAQGTTVVTWTYDDGNGNTSTQTQNVVIDDVTDPVADVTTLSNITSECSVTSLTPPTATDNCAGSVTGTHNASLPITAQGTTVVTWTYDDGNGNTSTQTQNVVIDDITAPVADVATLSNITSECEITSLTAPTATDNCAGSVTGTHNVTLPITASGTTTVTWTYDDGNGNTSTQTQNVVINDVTAPVADITSLAPVVAECEITSIPAPTATDNCTGTITGTPNVSFPITTQGTFTITWTYDDGNGNTSTQAQNVVIDDITAPVADVATLSNITSECSVTSLTAPTATDNCVGSVTGTHNASLPITTQGTTIVTWTYDDGNGNTSTQTQNVVIDDVTDPVADVTTLSNITSECSVTSLTAPTATDNCAGSIAGTHDASLPITASTTVTWTYDDGNGNTLTQTQNVIITPIDNGVTQVDAVTLSADATGYNYQWIDCNNGNQAINGATSQTYVATTNGSYAVEIDNGTCMVTSNCMVINQVGISEIGDTELVEVYPNPTTGTIYISSSVPFNQIEVMNSLGQKIQTNNISETSKYSLRLPEQNGVYFVKVYYDKVVIIKRIIKK